MKIKTFLKAFFTFSKKDRIGILFLLLLIIIAYALPIFFSKEQASISIQSDTLINKAVTKLNSNKKSYNKYEEKENFQEEIYAKNNLIKGELFFFDPNTLSAEGWKSLGLKEKTISTIFNYRKKGGRFYKREDLQKIWGLPKGFYESVFEYINIEAKTTSANYHFASALTENKQRVLKKLDINLADTLGLIDLPGIGNKLAGRIVNFRNKLGGFYSIDQIGETYGLPDSTFQKIKQHLIISDNGIAKININSATKEDLKVHPYIRWNLANAIVEYRNQHGNFSVIEDLKKITIIDESTFNKIAPYLKI